MPPKRSVDPNVAQVNYQTYLGQVLERLPPVIVESLYEIYNDAVEFCRQEAGYSEADRFKIFQRLLKEINDWDVDEINEETERVMEKVPWIRSALQQILVAQVHILLCVRNDQYVTKPKFTFDMPREPEIVSHILITAARKIRPRVKFFDHLVDEYEAETNLLAIEEIVRKAIESALHTLVPLDKIIDTQFGKKAVAKKKVKKKKVVKEEETEAEAGGVSGTEGNTEEEGEISDKEIDTLEQDAIKRASILEQNQLKKKEEEQKVFEKTNAKNELKLVKGEEHVDDVEEMVERLSKMDKDDPMRKELRRNLHNRLAVF